jgi:hypothetical protein
MACSVPPYEQPLVEAAELKLLGLSSDGGRSCYRFTVFENKKPPKIRLLVLGDRIASKVAEGKRLDAVRQLARPVADERRY